MRDGDTPTIAAPRTSRSNRSPSCSVSTNSRASVPGAERPRRHGVATIVISRCEGELDVNELDAPRWRTLRLRWGKRCEEKPVLGTRLARNLTAEGPCARERVVVTVGR